MRPRAVALALATLLVVGCGKYGPPLREAEAARARERREESARRAEESKAKDAAPPPAAVPQSDEESKDQ